MWFYKSAKEGVVVIGVFWADKIAGFIRFIPGTGIDSDGEAEKSWIDDGGWESDDVSIGT